MPVMVGFVKIWCKDHTHRYTQTHTRRQRHTLTSTNSHIRAITFSPLFSSSCSLSAANRTSRLCTLRRVASAVQRDAYERLPCVGCAVLSVRCADLCVGCANLCVGCAGLCVGCAVLSVGYAVLCV